MVTYVLILTVLTTWAHFAAGQTQCTTPNNILGKCVSIYDCLPLLGLAHTGTNEDWNFIDSSVCGYFQSEHHRHKAVCCPSASVQLPSNNCYTPENNPGRCVNANSCKYLADLLVPPVSQETFDYLEKSKCRGKNKYSVCCGPPDSLAEVAPQEHCKASVSANPPDPTSGCCGVDNRRGVKIDFTAPTLYQYPWLALVEYEQGTKLKTFCGGALISGRYVMSAAHCMVGTIISIGNPKNVILGEYDKSVDGRDCARVSIDGELCTDGELRIPIEKLIPHPDYNPSNSLKRHDIGLIRLQEMVPYTDFIRPICLPTSDLTKVLPPNFLLYEASWGLLYRNQSKNIKSHIDLPFIRHAECQTAYSLPGRKIEIWKGQLCAGGQRGNYSCKGGGGSPLMYGNGIFQDAIGVVSFGPSTCMDSIPNVYTKVFHYVDWIKNAIEP